MVGGPREAADLLRGRHLHGNPSPSRVASPGVGSSTFGPCLPRPVHQPQLNITRVKPSPTPPPAGLAVAQKAGTLRAQRLLPRQQTLGCRLYLTPSSRGPHQAPSQCQLSTPTSFCGLSFKSGRTVTPALPSCGQMQKRHFESSPGSHPQRWAGRPGGGEPLPPQRTPAPARLPAACRWGLAAGEAGRWLPGLAHESRGYLEGGRGRERRYQASQQVLIN